MSEKIVCRVLTGPTGSGKSELAFRLALETGWEIFCMDSMQIYRRMDIGTAKPTAREQEAVPHHMLDICEPVDAYSVSQYITDALEKVEERHRVGKEVLFVGGTGLYLEGMVHGMSMGFRPADEKLREELRKLSESPEGLLELDERLRRVDPRTADKLPMNDIRRRIRAIEVSESTGVPFSAQEKKSGGDSRFRWVIASTSMERNMLYDRINRRVDRMIREGLDGEVKRLMQEGVPEGAQSMQAIGYKEMIPYLRGEWTKEKAADEIRKGTRHYAKRQMTFLKRLEGIRYICPDEEQAQAELLQYFTEIGE
jgi:tRNA dimethylallyltransferase